MSTSKLGCITEIAGKRFPISLSTSVRQLFLIIIFIFVGSDVKSEFEFRFRLDDVDLESLYDDPVLEMIRAHIAALLDCVILLEGDRETKINGFKLINDPQTRYEIFRSTKKTEIV